MFEQSLFNQELPERVESHEGELFHGYEIKNWNFSPRLYKILGISAGVNLIAILIVAQTSLLTMKGCDSPFVNRVCQVLDTVYVGSVLFGTDREYVDAAYDQTDLKDADITFIDVSGETPPLTYPEGYFALANPEQYAMLQQQANDPLAGFSHPSTSPSAGDLLKTRPVTPKSNPNSVIGDLPTSPLGSTNIPGSSMRKRNRGGNLNNSRPGDDSPSKLPDLDGKTADAADKDKKGTEGDTVSEVEINRKPLQDLADTVLERWSSRQIDLSEQFTVVLDGVLTKEGKFDPKKSRWDVSKEKGDQRMIDVAKKAIEAVGDSGWFGYLRNLGVDKINFTLVQDDQQITAVITSSQKSPERAASISSGLNGILLGAKLASKDQSDERALLSGAKVTNQGTNFILNFSIPKPVAQEMINRKLKEAQAKKEQSQPTNGNAEIKLNQNTAVR